MDAGQRKEAASIEIGRRFCLHQTTINHILTADSTSYDDPKDDNDILEQASPDDFSFVLGEQAVASDDSVATTAMQQRVIDRAVSKKQTPVSHGFRLTNI